MNFTAFRPSGKIQCWPIPGKNPCDALERVKKILATRRPCNPCDALERVNSCRTDQTWLASGGNPGPRYLAVDNRRVAQSHVSVGQDRVGR